MAKKKLFIPNKLRTWDEAQHKLRLSHAHVQMARELGMTPKTLGKLNNHDQQPWKLPLPDYITKLYAKRFGKTRPDTVRSIAEIAAAMAAKKEARRSKKTLAREEAARRDKATGPSEIPWEQWPL